MAKIHADYHLHTLFSPDGKNSPEEMCRAALEKGLTEIAVTDHYEFYQAGVFRDKPFTSEHMRAQQRELERCRELFAGKLTIRRGVEIGQPQCNPEAARELMEAVPFDYVIGSVHKLSDLDLGLTQYTEENIPGLAGRNLAMLYELADREDFDCMGHIDIIKRYAARQGMRVDLLDWREQLEPILRRLIERGKGLEVNTSGLRQAARETLPSLAVLKLYRSLGGEILTAGSDAHCTADISAGFDETLAVIREAGFRYLARYEDRKPHFVPLDG